MNKRVRICASIVDSDLAAIKAVEPLVDLFEVRIDLIGDGWREIVGQLKKPWLACNRSLKEGGSWRESEAKRIEELLKAIEHGADIIDIELGTENLGEPVKLVKKKSVCLLSCHDLKGTPPLEKMREIVRAQLKAGADICKVVTTANSFEDNLSVLQLISDFPQVRVVAFTMGAIGSLSRVLCPLAGGDFTFASIAAGKEAASGQVTVRDLRNIYGMLNDGN